VGSFTLHLLYYRGNSLPHAVNRENLGRPHSLTGRFAEEVSYPLLETEFALQNVSPKAK